MALGEHGLGHDLSCCDLPGGGLFQLVALGEASLAQEPATLVALVGVGVPDDLRNLCLLGSLRCGGS